MTRFIIRKQISELEEEVYEFKIDNSSIEYICFFSSKRKSKDEPWGYDWDKFYEKQREEELNSILNNVEVDYYGNYDIESLDAINKIEDKYNPCCQGLLRGEFSYNIREKYPPKITVEEVQAQAVHHLLKLKVRM